MQCGLVLENIYYVQCFRKGKKIWEDIIRNLITTEGLNSLLTQYLKGSAYTAAWVVGLIDNTGYSGLAAGDTYAQIDGTNGWDEFTNYTEGARQTLTLGTASGGSIDNSSNKASFTIDTGGGTIKGAFVCSSGLSVLYGEGLFSGGDRVVAATDVLNVTVTLTASSA